MSFLPTGACRAAPLIVLLVALNSESAFAAWPHDPNVNLPICTQSALQTNPTTCSDGRGGAIILWEDSRFVAGTGVDLFIQNIDANGIPRWTANGFGIVGAAGNQSQTVLEPDGSGGAIMVWLENFGLAPIDLKAQRIASNGFAQWGPFSGVVVCNLGTVRSVHDVASDAAGGVIVAWSDNRAGAFQEDIYVQRLDASGNAMWTGNGVAVCTAAQQQMAPRVTEDGMGGVVIAWEDGRVVGSSDIYAQRVDATGVPRWTANGVPVCTAANGQINPKVCRDGGGGAIVTWEDQRTLGTVSMYAQHLNLNGVGLWGTDGIALSNGNALEVRITEDGSAGAIVAWMQDIGGTDYDVYAQRVSSSGSLLWTAGGVPVSAAPGWQSFPSLVGDGAGGALFLWEDRRTDATGSSADVYAQRISAAGVALWPADGIPITTAPRTQRAIGRANATTDGAGGAIVAWYDARSLVSIDIYAQRVDRFGYLGAEPRIGRVRDVPNDEGGRVKLTWNASPIEGEPSNIVTYYNIFRSVPPNVAAKAFASGVRRWTGFETDAAEGIHVVHAAGGTYYWEYAGRQDAYSLPTYSWTAATLNDQTPTSNPYTAFMVQARNSTGTQFWNSVADSGYSVDNVGPSLLIILSAVYDDGATTLRWLPSAASDLDQYRVYRGLSPSFPVTEATFVQAVADTGCVDVVGQPYYYKVTAVDIHGNESAPALAQSAATVDIAGWNGESRIESVGPNPMTSECNIRFALRNRAHVTLSIYDVRGRRVRGLVSESRDRGRYETVWDGCDDHGRPVPSAPYFYRFGVGSKELTGSIVILR